MSYIYYCEICKKPRKLKTKIYGSENNRCKICRYKREFWKKEKRLNYENKNTRKGTLGKKHIMTNGYMRIQTGNGFDYEHRHIWKKHHGAIPKGFVIHHIDGNKTNNDLSNLELLKRNDHDKKETERRWDMHRKGIKKFRPSNFLIPFPQE
jgi:hypothetical protein